MKAFAIFFLVATIVCAIFWMTDSPGSGMWIPTVVFAALGGGVLLYNKLANGSSLNDQARNGR